MAFNLFNCPLGGQATISITFTTDLEPSAVTFRKYNQTFKTFSSLTQVNSGISVARTTMEGKAAVTATYTLTDGGALDQDGLVNGAIVDPVGMGLLQVSSPNTGLQRK